MQSAGPTDSTIPPSFLANNQPTPSAEAERSEEKELEAALLGRALHALGQKSEEYVYLIDAVKLRGLTYEKVAEVTGKKVGAVGMQVTRAVKSLSMILRDLAEDT